MAKELIMDGVRFKRLPGSNYYVGPVGTILKVVQLVPSTTRGYHLSRKGKRVYRSCASLAQTYEKL